MVGVTGLAALLVPVLGTSSAVADYAPQSGDVVGVGGDTAQYAVSFAADGDTLGAQGFNGSVPKNRLVAFSATPDANGRSAYTNSVTTGSASTALNPTNVLRAGTDPVLRVSSSGAAISALLADQNNPEIINYVFSSSLPTSAQQTQAGNQGWGYLHVVEIGTDSIRIAVNSSTNAPTGLSIQDLLGIYTGTITAWNQIPGNSGGSSATIIPMLPPSGSTINKTFLADLKTANGGNSVTLASNVKTVEQNDPSAITGSTSPANAIVPFSSARLALWNSGYFYNPAAAFGTNDSTAGNNGHGSPFPQTGSSTALSPGISLLTGTPPDTPDTVYSSPITDYVIFRNSDASSSSPFEPGSSLNWVQALFSNPSSPSNPWFARTSTHALLSAAGITPDYVDLGNASSG